MKARTLKVWQATHTWSSLVSMLFLLMLCVTGLPLIFADEIDDWLGDSAMVRGADEDRAASYLPVDRHIAVARALKPGHEVVKTHFEEDRPVAILTMYKSWETFDQFRTGRRTEYQPDDLHFIRFNRVTGEPFSQYGMAGSRIDIPRSSGQKVMKVIEDLHVDLYAGVAGELFLGAMGVLLVVATVSGVVLYYPFTRKLAFGTVRSERSRRVKWLDLHNLLGVATVAWVLVVGGTGVIHDLGTPISHAWQARHVAPLEEKYADEAPLGREWPVSLQSALALAQQAIPDLSVAIAWLPQSFAPAHFRLKGYGSTPLTEKLSYEVLVDARTGEVADVITVPWYYKAMEIARPLHYGDYGGLPMKVLWFLLDLVAIVVLASGLYLWLARRRAARRNGAGRSGTTLDGPASGIAS